MHPKKLRLVLEGNIFFSRYFWNLIYLQFNSIVGRKKTARETIKEQYAFKIYFPKFAHDIEILNYIEYKDIYKKYNSFKFVRIIFSPFFWKKFL